MKGRSKKPSPAAKSVRRELPGLVVRDLAVRLIAAVTVQRHALDDALAVAFAAEPFQSLEARDKGLARLIAATVLRRYGELETVVDAFFEKPLPADRGLLTPILLAAAAQLLVLKTPPHAVINIAVEQCRRDRGARRFGKLANAVLRRVSERGSDLLAEAGGARRNFPGWMWSRWVEGYGEDTAARIAAASLSQASLDISVKGDAEAWARRLGGHVLATGTGSIRLGEHSRVEDLDGFDDGAWWVQDAAAALPATLFGEVKAKRIADLCAAPGGKTAQIASAGGLVTAVDVSGERLQRLRANLRRLKLEADVVEADVATWMPAAPFDGVLLDAPCTATGTIRRHPDIPFLKRRQDVARQAEQQAMLLNRAATMVAPGGLLIYCTCSLESEEGERQVAQFLERQSGFARVPVTAQDVGGLGDLISSDGDLRTLPFHLPGQDGVAGGLDGFYAARLRRVG